MPTGGRDTGTPAESLQALPRGAWQRRFSEHVMRDGRDYSAHLDYICYNPVPHRLVSCAHDWPWSSFPQLV